MRKYAPGNRKTEIIQEFAENAARKVNGKYRAHIRANRIQSLPEKIRWLRANQKPYMTLKQLSDRSGVSLMRLSHIENEDPDFIDMKLSTLRKIAGALGCQVYVNIKKKPSQDSMECLPLRHIGPPLPERSGRNTALHRALAAKYGSSPWKKRRLEARQRRHKRTSGKPDLAPTSER